MADKAKPDNQHGTKRSIATAGGALVGGSLGNRIGGGLYRVRNLAAHKKAVKIGKAIIAKLPAKVPYETWLKARHESLREFGKLVPGFAKASGAGRVAGMVLGGVGGYAALRHYQNKKKR